MAAGAQEQLSCSGSVKGMQQSDARFLMNDSVCGRRLHCRWLLLQRDRDIVI